MVRNDLFDFKGQRGTDAHIHYDMWALVGGAYRDSQFIPLMYSHFNPSSSYLLCTFTPFCGQHRDYCACGAGEMMGLVGRCEACPIRTREEFIGMRGIDTVLSLLTSRQTLTHMDSEQGINESEITATAAEILANISRVKDAARLIAVQNVSASMGRDTCRTASVIGHSCTNNEQCAHTMFPSKCFLPSRLVCSYVSPAAIFNAKWSRARFGDCHR